MTAPEDDATIDPQRAIAALRADLEAALADKVALAEALAARSQELARRNTQYNERIEYQSATSDVLKAMSGSPDDPQPVFDLIVRRARDLCDAYGVTVYEFDGKLVHYRAATGVSDDPEVRKTIAAQYPMPLSRDMIAHRAIMDRKLIRIDDLQFEPDLNPIYQITQIKSAVSIPLVRGDATIGALGMGSRERGGFTDAQIEQLKTFADQAVIAIESARLFNETQEALKRQTATADILKVIASSPDDFQPVFQAIADQSKRLLNGFSVGVYRFVDDMIHLMSFTPVSPAVDANFKANFPVQLTTSDVDMRLAKGEIFRIIDTEDESVPERMREIARNRGWRSVVFVPLLSDRKPIGAISVTRVEPGSFAEHHVQILRTFADQAVIAISNVELFQEVQKRTRELSQSLDDLRAAQDRLVQTEKLASLGQLTAGIAHEIKNPLNFVNNFSALSVELTDELNDVLKQAELAEKNRQEVGELTQMLKSNLEKIVQHGKRADSIVKNMLLHSREGSREQRPADVNALVEESLNLAYHGARAEKSGFEITLQRDFDANAGTIEVFPQEVSRALLNLISNGFYAATKRNAESHGAGVTVLASTKNLGSSVEIRIRDNGAGISPEVREKMFNPFFTTKPTGEGTGLGLSMTHDIIVRQHGGRIDVETKLGEFTEFIITLPRDNRPVAGAKSA